MRPDSSAALLRSSAGALTGVAALIGMIRLAEGGFERGLSGLAWTMILLAMVPWIGYAAWRARRSRLRGRSLLAVLALGLAGLIIVWVGTAGAVLGLACSLVCFAVIWLHDRPARPPRGPERFVRFDELQAEED